MYVVPKEPPPTSSEAAADEVMVPLSALGMAKTALYEAMREQGVGRAELARRLRWHLPQVNRVLDLRHASRMERVEAALAALGLRLIVDVARAAWTNLHRITNDDNSRDNQGQIASRGRLSRHER
jgi:antitoxin HicB